MAGVSAELTLSNPNLNADFQAFMRGAPDLFNRKVPSAARRVTRFAIQRLPDATPPDPRPKFPNRPYPLRWTSAKQRRAFFATNGFGGGIPYRRTGELMRSWRTETIFNNGNGFFALINTRDEARYVFGRNQQLYHFDIGWRAIQETEPFVDVETFANEQLVNIHQSLVVDWINSVS